MRKQAASSASWVKDKHKVDSILTANADKNFVKRIKTPDQYPKMDLGNGDSATHKMAWGEDDKGAAYVYPTIVHDTVTNSLKQLNNQEAWQHAIKNKEYIKFNDTKEADWFSRKYKAVWGKQYWDEQ